MNVKRVVLTVGIVISVVTISALISNYIFERNLRSLNLPEVSYEIEKEQQPTKALESIADKPVPRIKEKTEAKILYQPVEKVNRELETEYSKGSQSDISSDDVLRGIGTKDGNVELENREARITTKEGPPSQRIVKPLPTFEPIINDAGPIPQDSNITQSKLPQITEQNDYDDFAVPASTESKPLLLPIPDTDGKQAEIIEQQQYTYDGPLAPPGFKTKPLPPFAPVTNETGPIATKK